MLAGTDTSGEPKLHHASLRSVGSLASTHRCWRALPSSSMGEFSGSASTSEAKRGGTLAAALKAVPPMLAVVDTQIFRAQRMPPTALAWDLLPPDRQAIGFGKADDLTFGGSKSCPRYHFSIYTSITYDSIPATALRFRGRSAASSVTPHCVSARAS
jgi:hypothetical protein